MLMGILRKKHLKEPMFVGQAHSHLLHDPQQRNDMSQETDKNSNRQAKVRIHIL